MSQELEPQQTGPLNDRLRYAQALAAADLLPPAYRRKPANVLLAMEYGHALGLDTITAIQSVHVIEGKPTASAQLIGGLVRRAGHRLRVTGDDKHAVAEIIRSDDPDFVFRSEWTIARAQAANLVGKGVWKQYPAAMLKARAITEVARDACPEALAGVAYTAEELGADSVPSTGTVTTLDPAPADEIIEIADVIEEPQADQPLASEKQIRFLKQLLKQMGAETLEIATMILRENVQDYDVTFDTLTIGQASTAIETLKAKVESASA